MLDKIIFFNHFHKGDIYVSRALVQYVIDNISANEYLYYMEYPDCRVLLDIDKLKTISFQEKIDNYSGWFLRDRVMYANTWFNSYNSQCNVGLNFETLLNVFKNGLKKTINHNVSLDFKSCIPNINFSKYEIEKINKFMIGNKQVKVFLSDGDFLSGQSKMFSFCELSRKMAKKFPAYLFISTNSLSTTENIVSISDIIGSSINNLNECAYVSTFCKYIVGRGSSPATFTVNKVNVFERDSRFLSMTHNPDNAFFGVQGLYPNRFFSTSDYSDNNLLNFVGHHLDQ